MSETIVWNGVPVGFAEGHTYYTKRDVFNKFDEPTIGFSEGLLKMLKSKKSIKDIVIRPKDDNGPSLKSDIEMYLSSELTHSNGKDMQLFVPVADMEKITEENKPRVKFIDYNEMHEFLKGLKEKYGTNIFSQLIFFGEIHKQKKGWAEFAVRNCLRCLHQKKIIEMGPNCEIILVRE